MAKTTKQSWTDNGERAELDAAHLAAMESQAPAAVAPIVLPALDIRHIKVRLVGDTPLIVHRFSDKARKMMLDKQTGKATAGREKKDPVADFLASLYTIQAGEVKGDYSKKRQGEDGEHPDVWVEGGTYGFPVIAFKNAAVTACTSLGRQAITKVAARQAFHVMGELAVIEGKPRMREDMVRLQSGVADIRHRGEFWPWAVELPFRYNARLLSPEQLLNLLNTAGFGVGVGEWRPECDGSFGQFRVQ